MAQRGADLQELMDLKKAIQNLHHAIHQNRPIITRKLHGAFWKGPTADRFKSEWDGQFEKQLEAISQALVEAANAVQVSHDNIDRATSA